MECLREEGNPTVGGSAKFCGLPLKIGRAAASLMAMLMLHAQVGLQDLLRGDERVDCWELFCAPDSWLAAACQSEGLRASRINLHQGYDLYQPSTYDELRERFHRERPKRVWVSTRCTYWCPWTSLNYRSIEQKQNLEKFRRKERAMFKLLIPFLVEMLTAYPDTELFWEWPTRCYGWKETWLETLQRELHRLDRDWLFGRIDGCRYELRSQLGLLLQKRWTIVTSSSSFFQTYRNKTCVGNHDHDYVQGLETSRSAYYPWKMCKSIAQHWRRELYPEKWLHRLHSPLPLHLNMAKQEHTLRLDLMPQMLQDEQPSAQDLRTWQLQLLKYHKAAGHPNNYNLARIVKDSGRAKWQVEAALKLHCDDCHALQRGGDSSGKIPPASLRATPSAWEMVGLDAFEWNPPHSDKKYKILAFMDFATHFKVIHVVRESTASTNNKLNQPKKYWMDFISAG